MIDRAHSVRRFPPRLAGWLVVAAAAAVFWTAARRWAEGQRDDVVESWRARLSAMADDRSAAIESAIGDHLANAKMVGGYPTTLYLVTGSRDHPRPFPAEQGPRGHLEQILGSLAATHGYLGGSLLDPGLQPLAGWGPAVDEGCREAARRVLSSGTVGVGMHLHEGTGPVMTFGAPVRRDGQGRATPLAVLLLLGDPSVHLFPLLGREPLPTETGETVLFERAGKDVVFLSPVRHDPAPPLTLRRPLGTLGFAAAAALSGGERFGRLVDYRDVAVLAATRQIQGAEWGLVAKVDEVEALVPFRAEVRQGLLFVGALLLGASGLAFGLWRQQAASARLALARSEARFGHLLENAGDAILFLRPDGRIEEANRRAEELYGRSRAELTGRLVDELVAEEQRDGIAERMETVRRGPGLVFETVHLAKDGTRLPVEVSSRYLELDTGGVYVSIVRDVRERKAAERRIVLLNRILRTLSEVNALVVREEDRDRLLRGACAILVEHAGFRMAWIGLVDPETGWLVPAAVAGHEEGYLSETVVRTDDSAHGRGPSGACVREGRTVAVQDVDADGDFGPWREAARRRGYRSHLATPIRMGDRVAGAIGLFGSEPGLFEGEVVATIEELAGDVGFALLAIEGRRGRDEAQEALRASTASLEALIQASPLAVLALDPEGRVDGIWNPAAERVFGWRREEVLGRPLPFVPEESRADFRALHDRVLGGETFIGIEATRRRKDGSPIEVSIAAAPIRDAAGRVVRVLAMVADVSERVRSELAVRKLSAAVEQSPASVVITDTSGAIEYVNPAFTRLTGYTMEEVRGRNPRILKSGEVPAEVYQDLWKTITAGGEWHGELLNRKKGGEPYWEQASISALVDDQGRVTHYLAVKEDVTARKRADEELRTMREQLVLAQRLEAVGRLAGGVAHDFNNLLGVIGGYGEMVLRDLPPGSPGAARLEQVLRAAKRAAGLTRQLLAFSRRQVLKPQVLDLNAVVSDVVPMLRRLIGEDVELRARLPPGLGAVEVDPGQIEQVIVNLAVNARDAMPEGGLLTIETADATLDASYARTHHPVVPGRYVLLAVTDTGVGMDAATRERIFEPFYTTKPEGKGTGLGLATVYGIVKQSGGYIWVYSEPGHGTTLRIYLPRVDAAPGPPPPEAARSRQEPAGTGTVLVVEDQDDLRELVKEVLEEAGYRVLVARDGPEALDIGARHPGPIRLLLTDVVMPRMSGRELASRLRAARPETRVLYMSGYSNEAVAYRGVIEEGALLLQKPFGPDELARRVREALEPAPPA